MRLTDNVFDWKNVPKPLTAGAIICAFFMIWGIAQPSIFGQQRLILPFLIMGTIALCFLVYWTGTSKTISSVKDEPIRPEPQAPEQTPFFEDYTQMQRWVEAHPNAAPTAVPPKKGSHHYNARV